RRCDRHPAGRRRHPDGADQRADFREAPMPGPIRKPLAHPVRTQMITPAAIRLFDQIRHVRCTCPPIDWEGEYWKGRECPGCKRWWQLHNELHDELGGKPWEWPAIQDPEAQNPYPAKYPAHWSWQPDREAQARWRLLAAASREARRKARRAKEPLPA